MYIINKLKLYKRYVSAFPCDTCLFIIMSIFLCVSCFMYIDAFKDPSIHSSFNVLLYTYIWYVSYSWYWKSLKYFTLKILTQIKRLQSYITNRKFSIVDKIISWWFVLLTPFIISNLYIDITFESTMLVIVYGFYWYLIYPKIINKIKRFF